VIVKYPPDRRGLNRGNDPLRAALNWSALSELDITDLSDKTARADSRNV